MKPSVKTLHSPFFAEFWSIECWVAELNATLSFEIKAKKIKLFEWESNPQPVAFTLTCLCQFATNDLKYQKRKKEVLYKFRLFLTYFLNALIKKYVFIIQTCCHLWISVSTACRPVYECWTYATFHYLYINV